MSVRPVPVWTGPKMRRSAGILADVRDVQITWNFMRAMMAEMTDKVISKIFARLDMAEILSGDAAYVGIIAPTGFSSRIVARISDWVKDGYGRYKAAVVRSSVHHGHTMPVRAG